VFKSEHIAKVKGAVLTEGSGLVVYTFTGDKRGKAGTCTGECAAVWPPVRGVAVLAHGVKLSGKFGRINGQVTYNGWPLYLFTGEKPGQNHANSDFKIVSASASKPAAAPKPTPAPKPSPTPTGGYW
jgi:predicted lipoprotein with Yx(FWY)xxD motif